MFLAPVREQVARDPYSRLEIIESAATSATWSSRITSTASPWRFSPQAGGVVRPLKPDKGLR